MVFCHCFLENLGLNIFLDHCPHTISTDASEGSLFLGAALNLIGPGVRNQVDVSENSGFSPQIIHFNRESIINHPFWGTSIFGNTQVVFLGSFGINEKMRGEIP